MMREMNSGSLSAPEKTLSSLLSIVTTVMVLGVLGLSIYYFYPLASLLMIVLILTYILLGPVNVMEYTLRKISNWARQIPGYAHWVNKTPEVNPRILAVLTVYASLLLLLSWGGGQFFPVLNRQFGDMQARIGTQLVEVFDGVIDWTDSHIARGVFRNIFSQDIQQAEHQGLVKQHSATGNPVTLEEKQVIHQSLLKNTMTQVENALASALPNFIRFVGGTVNGLLYFLAGILLTFYFLVDGYKLKAEWICLFPANIQKSLGPLLLSFHQVMFAFVKGQVMLGVLTGAYMFMIYSIFHVPYAFLLGCLFAVAEFLPVVGTWIGITIGLTVILLNMPPIVALWVWLCSYAYQTIKDNILAPKVVGNVMGLHPMVIILSLLACAKIAGLLGVLVALPLASAINVVIRMLLEKDRMRKIEASTGNA